LVAQAEIPTQSAGSQLPQSPQSPMSQMVLQSAAAFGAWSEAINAYAPTTTSSKESDRIVKA
jgi:hypothetical protein